MKKFKTINTKFCSLSTTFGTVNLSLFYSTSIRFDNLCDIFIVPENDALPGLRFVFSLEKDTLFVLNSEYNKLLPVSPTMDTSECIELDILNFSDISEIKRIAKEAIKWNKEWKNVTFPHDKMRKDFMPHLPDPDYIEKLH